MSYGVLLLRVVVGVTVGAHGVQKLFGWFGGHGPRGTAGFFGGNLGYRAPLAMAVAAGVAVAAAGPGRFALDRLLGWDDNISGLWWGVGALGAAVVISAITTTILR